MSFLPLVKTWIVLVALASAAGWILSALGELNGIGYGVVVGLACIVWFFARRRKAGAGSFSWHRMQRRFARPLPLAFAALAALAFLGGVLYAPTNYDALTYRVPRVLHWLSQGQWHWIHTVNNRMNNRSCGFEWLMAPVFVATKSDRAFFLINFLPFLLLPGLTFSVFTRLGVAARVAWQWMWLLPTGYNFLLQAGSLGNDTYAAVFALAAVDFALRAAASNRTSDVYFSLLAAALLTGAKPGNLPLLLPWVILFLPQAPKMIRQPLFSLFIVLVALLASFLPTALLNSIHCGDWTGITLEDAPVSMKNPMVGLLGNAAMFVLTNFTPTIFPLAAWWNHSILTFLPSHITQLLMANFEGNFYKLGEIPTEESSGLGFGLSCLLALTVAARWFQRPMPAKPRSRSPGIAVLAAPYVALAYFFAKSGMMTLARLVSAYYPLLLPLALQGPLPARLVRRRGWRWATAIVMLFALAAVILTPARPLWPVQTVFAKLGTAATSRPLVKRVRDVYSVYAERSDPLARVRNALPEDCAVVGFVGESDDSELSFWRPFGRRRAEHIFPGDSMATILARGIHYVVVDDLFLQTHHESLSIWLQLHQATLIASIPATMTVADGPRLWHVARLDAK